ncbi:hypothetical protein CEXT_414351 [Caerostris extrusa]|uniref:Uncharacterized protein n=1 Tax=Caerostris extrusa TaxID=172846 RepID=A0AAV4NTV4_CAEEX|nr:hypothetical protein CEXT_414351 [Caerostris extrusa]
MSHPSGFCSYPCPEQPTLLCKRNIAHLLNFSTQFACKTTVHNDHELNAPFRRIDIRWIPASHSKFTSSCCISTKLGGLDGFLCLSYLCKPLDTVKNASGGYMVERHWYCSEHARQICVWRTYQTY